MASIVLICVCVGIILYRLYKYMIYKPPNFPPGPPRIPIFGSYLLLLILNYKHLQRAVVTLCKYYKTNIIGFYYGDIPAIVVHDASSVREALNNAALDGRPKLHLAKMRDPDFSLRGIFFIDGLYWKTQRRFTLRHLRDYGFGRRFTDLELEIAEEIRIFIDLLKDGPKYPNEKVVMENGNVMCPNIFCVTPANVFLKVLMNERLPREEHHLLTEAGYNGLLFQKHSDLYGRMFSLLPIVAKIFPNWSDFNIIKQGTDGLYRFMKQVVDEQYRTYDENHERSFLDLYFKEIKEAERANENTYFYYKQLVLTCVDFFFPPVTAVPVTLAFFIQRLILQPEIQTKIQQEIDDVVGHGQLPTLDDRINLPYTESALREIMRLQTLVPSNVPHMATEDTILMGYDVPKGCLILTALEYFHEDENTWKDPHMFKPERFLDVRGKFSPKKDFSLPFGAGKRLCAGETYARNIMFLMISALMQNFNVKAAEGMRLPDPKETITGLVAYPPDFWVTFEPRV